MMASEFDHDRRLPRHLRGRQRPVVAIEGQPGRKREGEAQGERGDDPPQGAEVGVSLPYVVEEGGPDQVRTPRCSGQNVQRRFEAVALVGHGLR